MSKPKGRQRRRPGPGEGNINASVPAHLHSKFHELRHIAGQSVKVFLTRILQESLPGIERKLKGRDGED